MNYIDKTTTKIRDHKTERGGCSKSELFVRDVLVHQIVNPALISEPKFLFFQDILTDVILRLHNRLES